MPTALNLPAKFGGLSIGDATARLAASFDRKLLDLDRADDAFCERRLIGRIVLGHEGDAAGQQTFTEQETLAAAFDVKGFSVKTRQVGTGLTFSLAEIDVAHLAKFAGASGRLVVDRMTDIPPAEKATEKNAAPLFEQSDAGDWEAIELDEIFDPKRAIRRRLGEAGINTLGQLAHYTDGETTELTDIEGIGPKAADDIAAVLEAFWTANPQYGAN